MRILNFTISYSLTSGNLYSDLNEALAKAGHTVKVVFADPCLKHNEGTCKAVKNGVEVLRVKTMKVQKVGLAYKAVSFLALPFLLKRAVKKHYGGESFDLVLFSAPPVTLWSVVNWAKRRFKCPAFLMQKDIFPQNAVDLKLFSKNSAPYLYFRRQEKKMLSVSDKIGCMSQGNIDYIARHNPQIDASRLILFPNTQSITPKPAKNRRAEICAKYGIPEGACVFLFGGNMGKPQHLDLLCRALKKFNGDKRVFFLCVGSGALAYKLKDAISGGKISNAIFMDSIPRADYEKISESCDVGLVVLSPLFTIPNYPSKTLSYMNSSLPILAATDTNTDYRDLIETQAKCGIWADSSDEDAFCSAIEKMASNPALRTALGANGRKYLEENFDVARSVGIIENLFGGK